MTQVLLFDLDDTLMVEGQAADAAFIVTASSVTTRVSIDPQELAAAARRFARELWYAAPTHAYCMRVGISSWEGLWCRFEGDGPNVRALREWAPTYRREAWRLALADQEIDDGQLADELADRFGAARRARHEVFADAANVLNHLARSHSLALVTNGAACLQREKLTASGLGDYFEAVVISADLDTAKPDPAVFEHALSQLGSGRNQAVMVGDSLSKDVDGALAAGLSAIWVNRFGRPAPPGRDDLVEISTLDELIGVLAPGKAGRVAG
jgi:putative hydrolase of the HAD superfamily